VVVHVDFSKNHVTDIQTQAAALSRDLWESRSADGELRTTEKAVPGVGNFSWPQQIEPLMQRSDKFAKFFFYTMGECIRLHV
jgi:hypothetical protein